MINLLFISAEKLGIAQSVIETKLSKADRRERKRSLHAIRLMLRMMDLVPDGMDILAIGTGCNAAGDIGVLVVCDNGVENATRPQS